jgi:catechol 2,3-dioxygenase
MAKDGLRGLTMGPVGLAVRDLGRSLAFYTEALGLERLSGDAGRAVMGAGGRPLLELVERPGAERDHDAAGLFHVALLQPDRAALGHTIRRLLTSGVKLTGAADHIVSEAVYLDDPDGHGIEVYADRPRASWPAGDGDRLRIGNLPLDRAGIMAAADRDPAGAARTAGVVVGHVHLESHDLPATRRFYLDRLGLDLMAERGKAVFMAADGYHHHLAANVWGQRTRAYADAAGRLGMMYYTMALPDADAVRALAATLDAEPVGGEVFRVRDPSGIEVRLAVA